MEANKHLKNAVILALVLGLALLIPSSQAAPLKVKVIVDNAAIKATPEIGGQTLANVPLHTVLDAELKQGEFYKISLTKDGAQIIGFVHELLVEETAEGETQPAGAPLGLAKSPAEIAAEIELKIEESKSSIRQEKDLAKAAENLRPLLAKAFTLDDRQRQKQIACEIYLWLGLDAAKMGDQYGALKEFRNMFEVDYTYGKEATRNISDPVLSGFIDHAEKQYRGLLVEYTLEIMTEPKEAAIKIDGQEIGLSPDIYRTTVPKFTLEISKEGYKPVKEDVFLSEASSKRQITLESIGRTLAIGSSPKGAKVYLDDQDTGKVTDCELPYVSYDNHNLKMKKVNYADWEESIEIQQGAGPLPVDAVLTVNNYVFAQKMGGPETRFFKLPKAVALDTEGNCYIADAGDVKLKKIDAQGRFQSAWADSGRETKILKEPSGIAVDGQGFVYVSDARAACVMKFGKNGKFVSKWGSEGAKPGELSAPLGLAVDRSNDIYVADSGNNRIVKYSTGGAVKKTWGKQGTGEGDFLAPTGVAVNQKNEIIVVDRTHIQKFSPEGEFIAKWARAGAAEGELNRPLGLAVDAQDYIYVADTGNNRVLKFDPNGKFITQWGSAGTADGLMTAPSGIAVSNKGSVFVVERDNNRLQEFKAPAQ
jgi:DNA-binding beta-propeller fold protein YncE